MLEEKEIELINRAVDGELDPQEQTALADLLTKNNEAQVLHQDLTRIVLLLQRAPKAELPRDIAAQVKARLSRRVSVPAPSKKTKLARAMAASLFIAVGILNFGGNTGNEEDIVGTLVEVDNGLSPYIHLEKERHWSIVIDIDSSSEFRLVLNYTHSDWQLNSSNIKGLKVATNDSHIEISGSGPLNITLPLINKQGTDNDSKPVISGVLEFEGKVFTGKLDH